MKQILFRVSEETHAAIVAAAEEDSRSMASYLRLLVEAHVSKPRRATPKKRPAPQLEPHGFAEFWKAYPRKVGKGAARRVWSRLSPPLDTVLRAVSAQQRSEQWLRDGGQYIPHPATWLNQERWEDAGIEKPKPKKPFKNRVLTDEDKLYIDRHGFDAWREREHGA